ncbi:TPA: RNA polymerase subunit sigma, partial [Neisseria meningitidis]
MGYNMMTTQKCHEHITDVIIGTTQRFNTEKSTDSIEYINERKGSPIGAICIVSIDVYAACSHAYL